MQLAFAWALCPLTGQTDDDTAGARCASRVHAKGSALQSSSMTLASDAVYLTSLIWPDDRKESCGFRTNASAGPPQQPRVDRRILVKWPEPDLTLPASKCAA